MPRGFRGLGHEPVVAGSEGIAALGEELAKGCDLVIDHTDTLQGRGFLRPPVRLLLEGRGAASAPDGSAQGSKR